MSDREFTVKGTAYEAVPISEMTFDELGCVQRMTGYGWGEIIPRLVAGDVLIPVALGYVAMRRVDPALEQAAVLALKPSDVEGLMEAVMAANAEEDATEASPPAEAGRGASAPADSGERPSLVSTG